MRRTSRGLSLLLSWMLALTAFPAGAQQGTINPRIPPPPPPPDDSVPQDLPLPKTLPPLFQSQQPRRAETPEPPAALPTSVAIPAGTRIAVVLDTPLSTRIARQGQLVTFRTTDALRLGEQLEIPPETAFTGSVIEVKRPGGFGKAGALRVRVERINLSTGATAEVAAHLDSPDMKAQGKLTTDNSRATDLYSLAVYSLEGTLLGSRIKGSKGAAVGAGAGALVALIIMMSKRGPDVYLEPGMPFLVILDKAVELPGAAVYEAQQSFARARGTPADSAGEGASEIQRNPDGATLDSDRPKLKHRPKPPQP